MEESVERVARNEALFRAVNERVESLSRGAVAEPAKEVDIVCEYGDLTCVEWISVPLAT
jgi:hypothetical protein